MEYTALQERLHDIIQSNLLVSATVSQPRQKSSDLRRVKLKPVLLRDAYHIQFEYQYEHVMKHKNLTPDEAVLELNELTETFRQGQFQLKESDIQFQLTKKFKVTFKEQQTGKKEVRLSHNREKQYVLPRILHSNVGSTGSSVLFSSS